ncbi:MAG: hypothetical protein ACR65T_11565 [Methylocystis sp.]|uniref:hypothetical protein n=1 Tax=Methylocystis sp. TaxID=1911079 RepID=UPI003DA57C5C
MKPSLIVLGVFMLSLSGFNASASDNRGAAHSQSPCFAALAESIRRHTPGSTRLSPGYAEATFQVRPGGRVSVVAAAGSTPEHAALIHWIIASSRGPKNCSEHLLHQSLTLH